MGLEVVSAALQLEPKLRVIEDLAVKDHTDGAVLVGDGLPSVGQADNAEPARGQTDARELQEPVLVGAAMDNGAGHGCQAPARNGPPPRQVDQAGNAAHRCSLIPWSESNNPFRRYSYTV